MLLFKWPLMDELDPYHVDVKNIVDQLVKPKILLLLQDGKRIHDENLLDRDVMIEVKAIDNTLRSLIAQLAVITRDGNVREQRLLLINYLEALMNQKQQVGVLRGPWSLLRLKNAFKRAAAVDTDGIAFATKEARRLYVQLYEVSEYIFVEDVKRQWINMLKQVASAQDLAQLQTLGSLVRNLVTFEVLPLWLHTVCKSKF